MGNVQHEIIFRMIGEEFLCAKQSPQARNQMLSSKYEPCVVSGMLHLRAVADRRDATDLKRMMDDVPRLNKYNKQQTLMWTQGLL